MTVRLAMTYTDVNVDQIDNLIMDPNVVFEQKFDGTFVMAVIKTDEPIRFLQRGGKVLAHTAATQHLDRLRPTLQAMVGSTPGELVVCGELIVSSGEYILFDVPYARFGGLEVVRPSDPYYRRRTWLQAVDVAELVKDSKVLISLVAETRRQKFDLANAVRDKGGEGLMAKNAMHLYEPGKRSKSAVKLKFIKTADVVVTAVDRPDAKHGSFKLGAWTVPRDIVHASTVKLIDVGGASAIGKDETIQVGDVVEVTYLYWTGQSLYQPRVMRKRTDKIASECTVDQFPEYSRATIQLPFTSESESTP